VAILALRANIQTINNVIDAKKSNSYEYILKEVKVEGQNFYQHYTNIIKQEVRF
jgi:hypothetical protein|tara:strand:- start:1816 stop:1977 length:162 start_codon:yes stop_codon:yes gene_type:complete